MIRQEYGRCLSDDVLASEVPHSDAGGRIAPAPRFPSPLVRYDGYFVGTQVGALAISLIAVPTPRSSTLQVVLLVTFGRIAFLRIGLPADV